MKGLMLLLLFGWENVPLAHPSIAVGRCLYQYAVLESSELQE